jgi:hypothetical protein
LPTRAYVLVSRTVGDVTVPRSGSPRCLRLFSPPSPRPRMPSHVPRRASRPSLQYSFGPQLYGDVTSLSPCEDHSLPNQQMLSISSQVTARHCPPPRIAALPTPLAWGQMQQENGGSLSPPRIAALLTPVCQFPHHPSVYVIVPRGGSWSCIPAPSGLLPTRATCHCPPLRIAALPTKVTNKFGANPFP